MIAQGPNTLLMSPLYDIAAPVDYSPYFSTASSDDWLKVAGIIIRCVISIIFFPISLTAMAIVGAEVYERWVFGLEVEFREEFSLSPENYLRCRFEEEARPMEDRDIEIFRQDYRERSLPQRRRMPTMSFSGQVPITGQNMSMYLFLYQDFLRDHPGNQMMESLLNAIIQQQQSFDPPSQEDKERVQRELKGREKPQPLPRDRFVVDRKVDEKLKRFIEYVPLRNTRKDSEIEQEIDSRMEGLRVNRQKMIADMNKEKLKQFEARDRYQDFWHSKNGSVEIDPSKCILFEDIFASFMEQEPPQGQSWKELAISRITESQDFTDTQLQESICRAISERVYHGWDDVKAMKLLVALLNLLNTYRDIMFQRGDLPHYQERFNTIIQNVSEALTSGCGFNRLAGLRTILSECLSLDTALLEMTGAQSARDPLFAITMDTVRTTLIRKMINKQAEVRVKKFCQGFHAYMTPDSIQTLATRHGVDTVALSEDFFMNRSRLAEPFSKRDIDTMVKAQPDVREEVELEYVVRQRLGWTTDSARAHFFGNEDPNDIRKAAVEPVERKVRELYEPIKLLISDLTSRYPVNRELYNNINRWYIDQGLEFSENRDLLAHKDYLQRAAEEENQGFEEPPQFNEHAIYYYMINTGLFRLISST